MKIESKTHPRDWAQRYADDFADFPIAYRVVKADPLTEPRLVCVSEAAAACLGMTAKDFESQAQAMRDCFAQGRLIGSDPSQHQQQRQPVPSIASVYAGHQFGVWAGQLGDGRALLLGDLPTQAGLKDWGLSSDDSTLQVGSALQDGLTMPNGTADLAAVDPGDRIEVQLKGAGQTPYSRMGDGRAVLRSSIREFLASEAMIGLGIPSTRALCLFRSDDPVFRETVESAAIVTRLAPSFLRFGHVEYFAHFQQPEALNHLLRILAQRHYPGVLQAAGSQPRLHGQSAELADPVKLELLKAIAARTGDLIARWQSVGFCHGVMNTDNMSLLGLTIDYGPFGFLDQYDEDHVCNHSDHQGRYSYANQPAVGAWNCRALAAAFRLVLSDEAALGLAGCLQAYRVAFESRWRERFAAKFGLGAAEPSAQALSALPDNDLSDFLEQSMHMLQRCKPDFTRFFRQLSHVNPAQGEKPSQLRDMVLDLACFDAWWDHYAERVASHMQVPGWEPHERRRRMLSVNPKYILRNHLAEVAISRARGDHGAIDHDEIKRLLRVLSRPFDDQPEFESYAAEPPQWAKTLSVSCSS